MAEHMPVKKSEFLLYKTEDGLVKLEVRLENESVWLTQQMMADLFQTTKQNISLHVQNIFEEGELSPEATVKDFLTVRQEGQRSVQRRLTHYNLDMIISVGYRVNSYQATQLLIWATGVLRNHILKGYSANKKRLKELKLNVVRRFHLCPRHGKPPLVSPLYCSP
jgi:hypothetical protein